MYWASMIRSLLSNRARSYRSKNEFGSTEYGTKTSLLRLSGEVVGFVLLGIAAEVLGEEFPNTIERAIDTLRHLLVFLGTHGLVRSLMSCHRSKRLMYRWTFSFKSSSA